MTCFRLSPQYTKPKSQLPIAYGCRTVSINKLLKQLGFSVLFQELRALRCYFDPPPMS